MAATSASATSRRTAGLFRERDEPRSGSERGQQMRQGRAVLLDPVSMGAGSREEAVQYAPCVSCDVCRART